MQDNIIENKIANMTSRPEFIKYMKTSPTRAKEAPTDRSTSPEINTTAWPIVTIPIGATKISNDGRLFSQAPFEPIEKDKNTIKVNKIAPDSTNPNIFLNLISFIFLYLIVLF